MAAAVFCLFFTSQKINIKRSPNTTKFFGEFLWTRTPRMGQRRTRGVPRGGHNPPGCAWGPRRAQVGCAHLSGLPHPLFALEIPEYSETHRGYPRSEVSPPQASVATGNQSRSRSGTLPEGGIITSGHLHHPGGHHDEEGVVHLGAEGLYQ